MLSNDYTNPNTNPKTWFGLVQTARNSASSALRARSLAVGSSGWRNPLPFIRFMRASSLSLCFELA